MSESLYIDHHEMNGRNFEIYLEYEYEIENDGIGGYEYWGMRGYDKGTDYASVTCITFDSVFETLEDGTQVEVTDKETLEALEEGILDKVQSDADNLDLSDDYPEPDEY